MVRQTLALPNIGEESSFRDALDLGTRQLHEASVGRLQHLYSYAASCRKLVFCHRGITLWSKTKVVIGVSTMAMMSYSSVINLP